MFFGEVQGVASAKSIASPSTCSLAISIIPNSSAIPCCTIENAKVEPTAPSPTKITLRGFSSLAINKNLLLLVIVLTISIIT